MREAKGKKIFCPLINKYIDEVDCFETGTVAEGWCVIDAPVGLMEIKNQPNFHERCLNCKNHIV